MLPITPRRVTCLVLFFCVVACCTLGSCSERMKDQSSDSPLNGTWSLVSSAIIVNKDTTITFPVAGQEMIKIFNNDTFAFFKHDLSGGKDSSKVFDAGAGSYKLEGENYSEHLAYCNYRAWEGHDFSFQLKVNGDTIIQSGIEKIDSLGVNQEIREVYVRKK